MNILSLEFGEVQWHTKIFNREITNITAKPSGFGRVQRAPSGSPPAGPEERDQRSCARAAGASYLWVEVYGDGDDDARSRLASPPAPSGYVRGLAAKLRSCLVFYV